MQLDEVISLFLDSRKRGTTGAKKKCSKKTIRVYEDCLHHFRDFLLTETQTSVTRYEGIRRAHIGAFCDWLDQRESSGRWSKSSVLQILRTLRTFFRWVDQDEDCQLAEHKGWQKYLPAIEQCPRREDVPQLKDLKSFKNTFNTDRKWDYRDYVITCLMLDTGIRCGEVCNLRLDHLLLDEKMIIVDGKTGPRPVAVTGDMVRLLKGWIKKRVSCTKSEGSPYVFVSKRSEKMDVSAVSNRFRKHRKKYNLPRITPHSLRHSFCTNYLRKGGDIAKLKMMTGHTTYAMLEGYLHLAKLGSKEFQQDLEKVSLLKEV